MSTQGNRSTTPRDAQQIHINTICSPYNQSEQMLYSFKLMSGYEGFLNLFINNISTADRLIHQPFSLVGHFPLPHQQINKSHQLESIT